MNFGFSEQMVMSEGAANDGDIPRILLEQIPGALSVHRAATSNDRSGTDYWVEMPGGHHLSVDLKARAGAYGPGTPSDDIALETWSVIDKKIGWTRDESKRTDYVLCWWKDTRRWCLLPFRLLCRVFADNWQDWRKRYKVGVQTSNGGAWQSESVFVPRHEIWAAIYRRFGGDQAAIPARPEGGIG